jgi:hypothetical protein
MALKEKTATSPGFNFGAVTPHDTNTLASFARALYIGGDGDMVVKDPSGTSVTFASLQAGTILPIQTNRVLSTSTTATNIVAIY